MINYATHVDRIQFYAIYLFNGKQLIIFLAIN